MNNLLRQIDIHTLGIIWIKDISSNFTFEQDIFYITDGHSSNANNKCNLLVTKSFDQNLMIGIISSETQSQEILSLMQKHKTKKQNRVLILKESDKSISIIEQ